MRILSHVDRSRRNRVQRERRLNRYPVQPIPCLTAIRLIEWFNTADC
jgi:hypothetical protein